MIQNQSLTPPLKAGVTVIPCAVQVLVTVLVAGMKFVGVQLSKPVHGASPNFGICLTQEDLELINFFFFFFFFGGGGGGGVSHNGCCNGNTLNFWGLNLCGCFCFALQEIKLIRSWQVSVIGCCHDNAFKTGPLPLSSVT